MGSKKKRYIIIGTVIILLSLFFLKYTTREKVYCGIVTNKINGIEYNKHTTTPDPILIVKFDVNQKKKEIHCSWITYTESEVNQKICFKENIMEMEPTWIEPGLGVLVLFFLLICGIAMVLNGFGVK